MRGLSRRAALLLAALAPLVGVAYRLLAGLAARRLVRGLPGASAYAAGSLASGELVPGLSDLDLVVVLGGGRDEVMVGREAVATRRRALQRTLGPLGRGVGVAVYAERDLADVAGGTALTFGLGGETVVPAGLLRPGRPVDDLYRRLHPGVYGPGRTWRLLRGEERTTREPVVDPAYGRLAAWLELQWWWRFAYERCTPGERAFAAWLSVKLVAEPARIWLWLAHGERVRDRREALARAAELLPEEEAALRGALAVARRLPRAAAPARADALAALLRLGERIAALVEADVAGWGSTPVRLLGGGTADGAPPLADWRARAMPPRAEEALVLAGDDPADPAALDRLAAACRPGRQPALRHGRLLLLPAPASGEAVLLRAVLCEPFDPVSFALLRGERVARFPEAPGLAAVDCARRAVAEHAAWLDGWPAGEPPALALDRLLTAARASLFHASVEAGAPALACTPDATVAALGADHPGVGELAAEALAVLRAGASAPGSLVEALRVAVRTLPGLEASA